MHSKFKCNGGDAELGEVHTEVDIEVHPAVLDNGEAHDLEILFINNK